MPVTPFHFGPSGLIGFVFRKWIDLPVFVLANVAVDVEVAVVNLMGLHWPIHRYCHTLLGGIALGAVWGFVAYLCLPIMARIMKMVKIPYQTGVFKMIISGILGVWLHVLIDAIYHFDVKPFWPIQKNYLFQLLTRNQVKSICVICLLILLVLYVLFLKKQSTKSS